MQETNEGLSAIIPRILKYIDRWYYVRTYSGKKILYHKNDNHQMWGNDVAWDVNIVFGIDDFTENRLLVATVKEWMKFNGIDDIESAWRLKFVSYAEFVENELDRNGVMLYE